MFCHKCGTQLPEDSGFCHKCGTKIVHADTNQQTLDRIAPTIEPKAVTVAEPLPKAPITPVQTSVHVPAGDTDFKAFVDNHVRMTTKFQSADDLLKNYKPSLSFVWICFGIPAVVGLLIAGPLGLLIFGALLGYPAARIAGGIIKGRYVFKTAGKFNRSIDTDELIRFLDEHLSYLSPYLHKWGYMEQVGIGVRGAITTAIANSAKESLQEVSLCAAFGEKQRHLSVIYVRPDPVNRESGQMEYLFGAEKNGVSWEIGFSRNTCLFMTAPVLQAAMEYYLKSKGGAE